MEWRDQGIIIGVRRHGESAAIVEMMTRDHGRHMGIVKGGRSPRMQTVLQPGNSAECVWRARLEEHLGTFAIEVTRSRAADIMAAPLALHGINMLGALLRLLPERDPHPALYETLDVMIDHLGELEISPALMVRFELAILTELGFGLDLSCCASTGQTNDLVYVSPKSGRAVSRAAGEPWRDRLLALPGFITGQMFANTPAADDIRNGFALTGFFLERDVLGPRGLQAPESRNAYLALVARG
jgi:DNA repair protein RecO (recombination protein O)